MVNRLKNSRDKERRGFKYHERDPKDYKERAERKGGMFDSIFKNDVEVWRPEVGDNTIRILPPTWEDPTHYGYDIWVHPRIGADNSTYLCLNKMKGERCPICEAAQEARDAGEGDDAKALSPKSQTVVYLLDRDDKKPQVYVWAMSFTMDKDFANLCQNKKTGKIIHVDHPEKGYDFSFRREGTMLNTRYLGLQIDRDPSPIDDDPEVVADILDDIQDNPIPDILNFYDADYLEKVMKGHVSKSTKDDDDDDKKGRGRSGRRRGDDDDERSSKGRGRGRDDDEDDDDDEREERSSRRRGDDDDERGGKTERVRTRDNDDQDDDDRSARRRGRAVDDDDDEKARPRKGRDDDDDDEKDDRRSSRRSRDDDDEKEERSSRRSSRDEDEDDRGSRRGRSRDKDDDDEDEADRRSSRRSRDDDDEKDEGRSRRGRDKGDDDEDDDRSSRRSRSRDDDDERGGRGSRRR